MSASTSAAAAAVPTMGDTAGVQKPAKAKPSSSAPGQTSLPISRVHKIIKADVRLCSKEAIFLISKATEYMMGKVTNAAYAQARLEKRSKLVKYQDLAAVTARPEWHYLTDVIPATIPLSKALTLRASTEGGSLLEPTDENHPSHPSSNPNGAYSLPVKKARKSVPRTASTRKKSEKRRDSIAESEGSGMGDDDVDMD